MQTSVSQRKDLSLGPPALGICAVVIMTKAPRPGAVKTRLTPPLTPDEAVTLNYCFLCDIANMIAKLGSRIQGIGCFTPANAADAFRNVFPANFLLLPQREGSLSERLIHVVDHLLARGFAAVCLMGSDSPTLPGSVLAEAVAILARPKETIVIGPTEDGGYYLIGLKKSHPELFEGIDWSTDRVGVQTLNRAILLGLPIHLLPKHYDVDDAAGLTRLCRDLLSPSQIQAEVHATATKQFLRDLIAREGSDRIWPPGMS